MRSETAVHVVVLAVDVRCDRATHGHEASPRGHRDEEARGNYRPKDLVHTGAGESRDGAGFDIEFERVHCGHVEDACASTLCCVPVAATESAG